jgi:hypothetical protein
VEGFLCVSAKKDTFNPPLIDEVIHDSRISHVKYINQPKKTLKEQTKFNQQDYKIFIHYSSWNSAFRRNIERLVKKATDNALDWIAHDTP